MHSLLFNKMFAEYLTETRGELSQIFSQCFQKGFFAPSKKKDETVTQFLDDRPNCQMLQRRWRSPIWPTFYSLIKTRHKPLDSPGEPSTAFNSFIYKRTSNLEQKVNKPYSLSSFHSQIISKRLFLFKIILKYVLETWMTFGYL